MLSYPSKALYFYPKAFSLNRDEPGYWLEQLQRDDKRALGKAITLLESRRPRDAGRAQDLIELALAHSGKGFRLGITGVPGAGKSTFIDALGMHAIERGKRVAVLAVDPSSAQHGGSILGDKTRMARLAQSDRAFIRPSATGGALGGVTRRTREAIIICEAAGYDFIIVETVGVGQSETEVRQMTDFFLLLHLSGAGDTLQGIKRGVMEVAEAIAVNKADGDNRQRAEHTRTQLRNALHFFPALESGWQPQVLCCSALEKRGIAEIWALLQSYEKHAKAQHYFEERRKRQRKKWFYDTLNELIIQDFYAKPETEQQLERCVREIENLAQSPYRSARRLFERFRKA